jgi:Domain of unknown function (DUF4157)
MHQRTHKSNSSNASRQEKGSPFFRHTAIVQAKQNSSTPPTQEEIENNTFAQKKFEAVGLQIKQTKGTITLIEQERLGVLQAKMDDLLIQRQERASRFGHHLANISLHSPDRPVSAPVQPKLPFGLSRVSDTQQSVQKSSKTPWSGGMSLEQGIQTVQNHLGSPIQAKLMIGQPGDKYEQEADRVAQQVVQQLNTPKVRSTQLETGVQRQSKPEEDELRMKPMAMRSPNGGMDASADLENEINRNRGIGQPLDAGLQQSMGQVFGADFSGVRVHADAQSDQLNRSIQARAFTTGQDMFFRQGAYQPGSRGGQELIAHELTHVVQQNGEVMNRPTMHRKEGAKVKNEELLEREVNATGAKTHENTMRIRNEKVGKYQKGLGGDKFLQRQFTFLGPFHAAVIQRQIGKARMAELVAALHAKRPDKPAKGWPFANDCKAVMQATEHNDWKDLQKEYKNNHDPEYIKVQSNQAAAKAKNDALAQEQAKRQEIQDYVATHNVTQVFNKYRAEMQAANTTTGAKRSGGVDPKTGELEDGVNKYSRTYTFDMDPKVGEVHIHWHKFSNNWHPVKMHFKKAGKEGELGAQHHYNVSLTQAQALGITASAEEKLTDTHID